MNNFDYKKIPPFKWFVLQNFPFIEEDFDAITNYELMSKIIEYLNLNIEKTNKLGDQVEILTNWFENLDVQDEVDKKIDEMYENGQLQEIITQYLEINGVLAFTNKSSMKSGTNFVSGSIVKTLGDISYTQGDGHFYRVRTIQNTDVVDEDELVALTNFPTLVAEKVPEGHIINLENKLQSEIDLLSKHKMIIIGDSYSHHEFEDITTFWWETMANNLDLTQNTDFWVSASDGAGFYNDAFYNRIYDLRNTISDTNKTKINEIYIVGGLNDRGKEYSTLLTKMTAFNTYAKATYPNAKIILVNVGRNNPKVADNTDNRVGVFTTEQHYENIASILGWKYVLNANSILHNYDSTYWEEDGAHPSQVGQTYLGNQMTHVIEHGYVDINESTLSSYTTVTASGVSTSISNGQFISGIKNGISYLKKAGSSAFYISLNDEELNMQGNTAYEIATISDGYFMGTGVQSGVSLPIIVSGTLDGANVRTNGYADLYCDKGKIYIRPLAFYNNTAIKNKAIQVVYIPCFGIECLSEYA